LQNKAISGNKKGGKKMYYTIPEAMKVVKVSQRTLYTWIESGKLPIIKIGKVTRIDEKDLEKFMQSHKIRYGQPADTTETEETTT